MINTMRHIAIGSLLAASIGAGAQTQETNTVGNPQLKDFELPGTRTTPPPAEQPPAPPPPPPRAEPTETRTPPPVARPTPEARTPDRVPERAAPEPATQERAAPPPAPAPEEAPAVTAPPPLPVETLPQSAPVEAPPVAQDAPTVAEPAEPETGFPWLYVALAGLLALLGFAAFRKFSARPQEASITDLTLAPQQPLPRAEPAPPPAAPPAPATAAPAAASGIVGIQIRPWIELEFKPDRAAATLTDASVQYELTIRNKGNAPARNIRIEARMFNAGPTQEQEIGEFFGEPVRERTPPALAILPARGEVKLRNAITVPKEEVREITIQGRRLFIPTVAFNVIYDYGDNRSGQTSTSYVVGREADTPSEKMGAFRLDLGPRLYRSVGQRQTKLARIV